MNVTIKPRLPVHVAYVWFIAFAAILLIPFVWYAFNNALTVLGSSMTSNFPSSFNSTERSAATSLFTNFWSYMPIVMLIPIFIWAIMETLKEKRRREIYGY